MAEKYALSPDAAWSPMVKFQDSSWVRITHGNGRTHINLKESEARELLKHLQRRFVLDSLADI